MTSRLERTTFSNNLRGLRKKRGLRLRDVARLVGLRDESHVWEWESGRRLPSLQSVLKLSAALRCPVEVLFSKRHRAARKEVNERQERFNINIEY